MDSRLGKAAGDAGDGLARQRRERELFARVENDLKATAEQIRHLLESLPPDTDERAHEERKRLLNHVKTLMAYCKRKGMLVLAATQGPGFSGRRLSVVAREAETDLRSVGIECGVLVDAPALIPVVDANMLYDCFYDCIVAALPHPHPVVMAYISAREGHPAELRVSIECGLGLNGDDAVERIPLRATSQRPWVEAQSLIASELKQRLAARGEAGDLSFEDGCIIVRVQARGVCEAMKPSGREAGVSGAAPADRALQASEGVALDVLHAADGAGPADRALQAADDEALQHVRARIHDVMGQRLSMLHRAIEDDAISDEVIDGLKVLINGIFDSLSADEEANPDEELAATVSAFSLAGVHVHVNGTLPEEPQTALLFVDCIREAATNAVHHARATHVEAQVDKTTLVVENDGVLPDGPIMEGSGLASMRRAVGALGGTLEIRSDKAPFRLTVKLSS